MIASQTIAGDLSICNAFEMDAKDYTVLYIHLYGQLWPSYETL